MTTALIRKTVLTGNRQRLVNQRARYIRSGRHYDSLTRRIRYLDDEISYHRKAESAKREAIKTVGAV